MKMKVFLKHYRHSVPLLKKMLEGTTRNRFAVASDFVIATGIPYTVTYTFIQEIEGEVEGMSQRIADILKERDEVLYEK
jgi:hypothetical protein